MAKISSLDGYAQNINARVTEVRDEAGAHFKQVSHDMNQRLQANEQYLNAGEGQPPPQQAHQNDSPRAARMFDIGSLANPNFQNEVPPNWSLFRE